MSNASNRREGHLFPRRLDPQLPVAVKADGVWIEDQDGNRYLDASGGAIVVNAGHGRKEIAQAVYDQILAYDYIHPTMFTTPAAEGLADALVAHAPEGIGRFYFLSGGAEAVEAAIKLARQIHLANGRPDSQAELMDVLAEEICRLGASQPLLRACIHQSELPPFLP